jgi:bleomycin hydrolase
MGAQQSKPATPGASTSAEQHDEKLAARLSQMTLKGPLSADGSLRLAHLDKFESSDVSDPRIRLSRTVLAQTNIRDALVSRSAKIADTHIYNTEIDFKTSPITSQK